MHWLSLHWDLALTAALLVISEIMPALPTKANSVLGAIFNIGKMILASKGKALPAVKKDDWTIEEPK